jgi:acyl carrier protein
MNVKEVVIHAIVEVLKISPEEISFEKSLSDDFNADSLDQVEIIMSVEDNLGIEFDSSDYEKISSLTDLVDLAERTISKK